MEFLKSFNNRELAILFWTLLFLLFCLSKKEVRSGLLDLIKAFFAPKLVIWYISVILYISGLLYFLKAIYIWDLKYSFLTVIWVFTAVPILLKDFSKASEEGFFTKVIKDSIKGIVVIEFIANMYVFPLLAELFIVFFVTLMTCVSTFASMDEENAPAQKVADWLLVIFGLSFLAFSSYKIITDFDNFSQIENYASFALPILLSTLFLPMIYITALSSCYESYSKRLQYLTTNKEVEKYLKLKTILTFHFKLKTLAKWNSFIMGKGKFDSIESVNIAMKDFKETLSRKLSKLEEKLM